MKRLGRITAALLAACALVPMAACGGGGESGMDGDTYVLTVYRSRNSGMTDGDRDDEVKEAIEQAFY